MRLVKHPSPRGHIDPYTALEKVTEENMRLSPTMWQATFGKARRLAALAEQDDTRQAGIVRGEIMVGCVSCHQVLRGIPGESPRLARQLP